MMPWAGMRREDKTKDTRAENRISEDWVRIQESVRLVYIWLSKPLHICAQVEFGDLPKEIIIAVEMMRVRCRSGLVEKDSAPTSE